MTHTPAPWAFDGLRVYAPAVDETILGEQRSLIALVYAPPNAGTVIGNADLIAAAPDLLEVLKDLYDSTLELGSTFEERIRDVLLKAQGLP